jgi:hypothetical protein
MSEARKIVICGVGGHAWLVMHPFIDQSQDTFSVFNLPVDYGGSQGMWMRQQDLNNGELNVALHGHPTPVLPWADYNKTIVSYMTKSFGSYVGDILDFRSDILENHASNIDYLSEFLALTLEEETNFKNYFAAAFNYYLKHIDTLKQYSEKEFCFGYPWQEYVYWQLGGVADVDKYYHSKRVYPEHLHLYFTAKNRLVLTYQSEDLTLTGEDVIDIYNTPLNPQHFGLQKVADDYNFCSDRFISSLQEADYVIIPVGSVTNWIALLNIPQVQEILKTKSQQQRLIWIVNPYAQPNEMSTRDYLLYFQSLDIKPHVVGFVEENKELPEGSYHGHFSLSRNAEDLYDAEEVTKALESILTKA